LDDSENLEMAQARKKDVLRAVDDQALLLAKTLVRSARFGALATVEPRSNWPLASRVGVATDPSGAPLILVSGLAAHTPAMRANPKVSLLLGEPGKGDPLAHPRITLCAEAQFLERGTRNYEWAERRYLARHPKAQLYAGLGDFTLVRLEPVRASLNGGFGRAYELSREDLVVEGLTVDAVAASERGAVQHMNADHRDAIALYASHFAKAPEGEWLLTGIDVDGLDVSLGDDVRRVTFPRPLRGAEDIRMILVEMARTARGAA
jgi:heme iron utilization protein